MAVAIVNYNTCAEIDACLAQLTAAGAHEILVVDNGSTDGSIALISQRYPHVRLHVTASNVGYGAAANIALSSLSHEYVLLLNSDTRVGEDTLSALSAYMDAHPRAAVVGSRLLNTDGTLQPSCYEFPTPGRIFWQESGLEQWQARRLPGRRAGLRHWAHDHARSVPWVLGAALAIRRQPFWEIGGFDPGFFMYAEEVDLCYRLGMAGWEVHFAPVTEIVHRGGASTAPHRAEMAWHFYRSLRRFYAKHYSPGMHGQLLLVMKAVALARLGRDLLSHRRRRGDRPTWQTWLRILADGPHTDGVQP